MAGHATLVRGKREYLWGSIVMLVTLLAGMVAGEIILKMKNSDMKNYDIEMWRYAKELKMPSANPLLGHQHRPQTEAILQSVNIRLNAFGLRGPELATHKANRRILFLGSSVTLGWGVEEKNTVTSVLEQNMLVAGNDVSVFNGGIGNYNTVRYVELFFTKLSTLDPTDIVVHYFINDAEQLEPGNGNWFLRNSQLAVTMWIAMNRLLQGSDEASLVDHYENVYKTDNPGYIAMVTALRRRFLTQMYARFWNDLADHASA